LFIYICKLDKFDKLSLIRSDTLFVSYWPIFACRISRNELRILIKRTVV